MLQVWQLVANVGSLSERNIVCPPSAAVATLMASIPTNPSVRPVMGQTYATAMPVRTPSLQDPSAGGCMVSRGRRCISLHLEEPRFLALHGSSSLVITAWVWLWYNSWLSIRYTLDACRWGLDQLQQEQVL
jgi:hypothetical protein